MSNEIGREINMNAIKEQRHTSTLAAWFICGLGALFYSYEYVLRILPSVMKPELMAHYHVHATALGILAGIYYWGYVPMQLVVGILMDRYGPRRLLSFACAMCVVGSYLFVCTDSYTVGMIGRFFVGFGSAFAFVGVLKLATIWLPQNKLGMVSGLAAALGTFGGIVGMNALTALVNAHGWYETTLMSGTVGIVLVAILWFFIRDNHQRGGRKTGKELPTFREVFSETLFILSNRQIWCNGLVGCLIYLPTTVFAEMWGISYLRVAYHFPPKQAAMAITVQFLGFTIGAPFMGWLSDKLQTRRMPMMVGALLAMTLFAILIYVPNLSIRNIYICLFLLGMSYGAQALVFAVARELTEKKVAGTAIATTNMIVMLGASFIQPLVGYLLDWNWKGVVTLGVRQYTITDFQFALRFLLVGIFFSAVFAYFLKETYEREEEA